MLQTVEHTHIYIYTLHTHTFIYVYTHTSTHIFISMQELSSCQLNLGTSGVESYEGGACKGMVQCTAHCG